MAGVPTTVCPSFAGCTSFRKTFLKPKGYWKKYNSGYTPQAGDLIFFNWDKKRTDDDDLQHVGIVEKVTNGTVYTIEGNSYGGTSQSAVRHKSYLTSSVYIAGYGAIPYESISDNVKYTGDTTTTATETVATGMLSTANKKTQVKTFQTWMRDSFCQSLTIDGSYGSASKKCAVKVYQMYTNIAKNTSLTVDGSFGSKSKAAATTLSSGDSNMLVYLAKGLLVANGYDVGTLSNSFDANFVTTVKLYQTNKKLNSLTNYGKIDATTWASLLG
jgi:hypothetical protein